MYQGIYLGALVAADLKFLRTPSYRLPDKKYSPRRGVSTGKSTPHKSRLHMCTSNLPVDLGGPPAE